MFTGALSLLMAVCGTFCFWRYFMLKKAYGETDWAGGGIAFSVATFILFVVFVFFHNLILQVFGFKREMG